MNAKKTKSRKTLSRRRKEQLSPKRIRQYKHILESESKAGRSEKTAKRISMATVNKTRRSKGKIKKSK